MLQADEQDGTESFYPDSEADTPRELTEAERRRQIEQNENAELAARVVELLLAIGIAKAKPHVKQMWRQKARPAIQAKWENRTRFHKANRQLAAGWKNLTLRRLHNMTSPKAQARLVIALLLGELSDEQLVRVTSADIVFGEAYEELERRLAELPAQQVTHMIESITSEPSLLADQLLDFERLLGLAAG